MKTAACAVASADVVVLKPVRSARRAASEPVRCATSSARMPATASAHSSAYACARAPSAAALAGSSPSRRTASRLRPLCETRTARKASGLVATCADTPCRIVLKTTSGVSSSGRWCAKAACTAAISGFVVLTCRSSRSAPSCERACTVRPVSEGRRSGAATLYDPTSLSGATSFTITRTIRSAGLCVCAGCRGHTLCPGVQRVPPAGPPQEVAHPGGRAADNAVQLLPRAPA